MEASPNIGENKVEHKSKHGQSSESIEQNISFFRDNLESYSAGVQNLDTYVTLKHYINNTIKGIDYLLDIGNGGVFDYDVSIVPRIVGLDLFLDKLPPSYKCPSNVTLKTGSALDIPEPNNHFDGVIMVMLIHHLIGKTVKASIHNVEKAIEEAYRVLKPGGKMIIVESCVPKWFYYFEKLVFPLAERLIDKIFNHPATLQYPALTLKAMLKKHFQTVETINIPIGRKVMIYGLKVPSILTPVSPKIFIAEK